MIQIPETAEEGLEPQKQESNSPYPDGYSPSKSPAQYKNKTS